MVHIKKVKLFNGELRYAVVEPFESSTKDKNNDIVTKVEDLVVDYKVGKEIFPAMFSVTKEGLERAKEIQKLFKNNK